LALAVSLEHLGETQKNQRALTLGSTLNKAIERLLENRKSPGRKVGCSRILLLNDEWCTAYAWIVVLLFEFALVHHHGACAILPKALLW
jgi:hypothetical protein